MPIKSYLPKLDINDSPVPLLGFSFSASASDLGVKADVTIADPSLEINRGDQFDLTLRIEFGSQPKSHLIKNGIVAGNSKSIAANRLAGLTVANDSFSITGIDSMGFRWKLAPRVPIIIFDPQSITLEGNELDSNVNDADGNRIYAEATWVNGLDLNYILNFAYVTKCGFDEVVHNLPNYRIPRVDFSLSSSFHSIVASFYSLFKPIIFEDDNRLFIIDVDGEIPGGILSGARLIEADGYINYVNQNPETAVVNAVLLSHKEISFQGFGEDQFPDSVTHRTEVEFSDVGTPFTDGWQHTTFTRYIAEIHDDEDDPGRITSEITWRTQTVTSGFDEEGTYRELSNEIQTDRYSNSWRLKLGYFKSIEAYVDDGSGSVLMQNVLTENNFLIWRPSIVNPGEYEKVRSQTQVEGLVLIEGEEPDQTLTPLIEAARNKAVPDDGSAPIERRPISSSIEVWRYTGADQIEVHIQKIDQLTKRVESTKTVEHIGTNAARVRSGNTFNTKQVLLNDADSDLADGAREPISFDAGFVTYPIAKELAFRAMAEATTPRPRITCQLASFDAGIRRGSIRNIRDRDGNEVTAIITGYSITGTQAARGQILISQSIEGVFID
jgi:hypothetical protein